MSLIATTGVQKIISGCFLLHIQPCGGQATRSLSFTKVIPFLEIFVFNYKSPIFDQSDLKLSS
jgi:hypothetical protein